MDLKNSYKSKKLTLFAYNGFYFDFVFKKLGEIFIRNVFVFAALFLGEKYMIEHLTKKVVDNFVFNSNKFVG